jgi:hypothetical protein
MAGSATEQQYRALNFHDGGADFARHGRRSVRAAIFSMQSLRSGRKAIRQRRRRYSSSARLMGAALAWSMAAIALGFLIGHAVGQASTCAVTAAKEIVHHRRARLLAGFLVASGVAGLLCLPLAWTVGMRAGLPPEAGIGGVLIGGALLLAAGALVNDACLFGTLARLSQGEVRFLGVPVGLFIGYALVTTSELEPVTLSSNLFGRPSAPAILLIVASAVLLATGWAVLNRGGDAGSPGRWRLRTSMLVLGGAGALLFVLTPGWTYSEAVRQGVQEFGGTMPMAHTLAAILTGLATLAGALTAGVASGSFILTRPAVGCVCRSISGGALMAIGAAWVPGGNDHLLLWSVPGGSVSGLVAYLVMSGAILAAVFAQHRIAGARMTAD